VAFMISARVTPLGRPIISRIFAPLLSARGVPASLAAGLDAFFLAAFAAFFGAAGLALPPLAPFWLLGGSSWRWRLSLRGPSLGQLSRRVPQWWRRWWWLLRSF
jgi:hypothetical protein